MLTSLSIRQRSMARCNQLMCESVLVLVTAAKGCRRARDGNNWRPNLCLSRTSAVVHMRSSWSAQSMALSVRTDADFAAYSRRFALVLQCYNPAFLS